MKIKFNIYIIPIINCFVALILINLISCKENGINSLVTLSNQNDSLRLIKLINEVDEVSDNDIAFYKLLTEAKNLSKKINNSYCNGRIELTQAMYFYSKGNYDSANYYNMQAINTLEKTSYYGIRAGCYLALASNYVALKNYAKGTEIMLMYLNMAYKYDIAEMQADANNRVAEILIANNETQKALTYLNTGIDVAEKNQFKKRLAYLYITTSNLYKTRHENARDKKISDIDSAILYNQKTKNLFTELVDSSGLSNQLLSSGMLYNYFGKYNLAYKDLLASLDLKKIIASEDDLMAVYASIATSLVKMNKYFDAQKYLDTAMYYSNKYNDFNTQIENYNNAIAISKHFNNYERAYGFLQQKKVLEDSVLNANTKLKISELEVKFDVNEKQKVIKKQQDVITNKQNQFILLILISAILLLVGIIVLFYLKNTAKLKLLHIEKTSSLKIISAEQTERIRIARELHDGIGQKLSVLKMYESVDEVKNKNQIELLDATIIEVRNISHNLMPEILSLGLQPALKDLSEKINLSNSIKCTYNSDIIIDGIIFSKDVEATIYRIVQEILNNMIKHAKASEININLTKDKSKLLIAISDNGVGFETKNIHESKGIGWGNILTRSQIINAKLDISSSQKGTHINLHVNA